jgi:radical SAM protein with 4Fe4S-binding SPASM domain
LLDDIALRDDGTMVVLTGGEPLIRHDLESIIQHGTKQKLSMVLGTNGALLTRQRIKTLKAAGLMGVGISLDSLNATFHDQFRGQVGNWKKVIKGIEHCREAELAFQLHFTVTDGNAHELDAVIDFAKNKGAKVVNIFFLVCTGRGRSYSEIHPRTYEAILQKIIEAQAKHPELIIRPRCAPHFKRIAYQLAPDNTINQISGYEGDGCIAGIHYARVNQQGDVTACPYIDTPVGNIRQQSFNDIWENAEAFQQLRQPKLTGRCGVCEYQKLCGGCRARPIAAGKSLMDEDDFCSYQPQSKAIIQPLEKLADKVSWSAEAEKRLQYIPRFIRKMVKKRAEVYVLDQGENCVTTEHLATLSARRFAGKMPKRTSL